LTPTSWSAGWPRPRRSWSGPDGGPPAGRTDRAGSGPCHDDETAKSDVAQLPTTIEELLVEARACEAAGAALIHVHIRDDEHRPTLDLPRLRETVAALREQTDLVVQLSTGGSVHDGLESRLAVLDAGPDSCSLTCGSTNFGDEVFLNPWPFMVRLYEKALDLQVVPEFELFDLGQVHTLRRLIEVCGLPRGGRVHCDFVLGVPGAMPATVAALVAGVQALPPEVTSWSATGIGGGHLPVIAATLAMGGHLRVGMEDTLSYAKGRPVRSNLELVQRAARLAAELQRPPMGTRDCRRLLGISR
jgi:3-keto-5-aminohexanoate cleavage enzyme